MGKYRIIIEGEGPHSNGMESTDADKVGLDTVTTLQAMGHKVTHAEAQFLDEEGNEKGGTLLIDEADEKAIETPVAQSVKAQTESGDLGWTGAGWMDPLPIPEPDRRTGEADEDDSAK